MVIFAVGVALAGPASGWILEGIRSLVGRSDPDPAARVEDVGGRESGGATAFVPVGAELVVSFSSPETRGTFTIAVVTDSVVAITPPSSAVELAVEGNRLSVGNAAAPVGAYRLSVPASVRTVRVRVPGAEEAVVDLAAGGGESPPAVGRTLRLPPEGR